MSSKPQPQADLRPDQAADAARTVPGTDAAVAAAASTADDEDERETLRAPPRLDQTPTVVPTLGQDVLRTAAGELPAALARAPASPPPLPRARISVPLSPPGPAPAPAPATVPATVRANTARLGALPPPLPSARASAPAAAAGLGYGLDGDTLPAASEVGDDDDTRKVPLEPAFVSVTEIKIPPLPMPKDMAKLLELEGGASASPRAPAHELRPPTYVSTLSPAERAAHERQPRRGRVLAGFAIAAAGVVAIGVSAWWQPVAEPVLPKRAAAAPPVEAAAPPAPASNPLPTPTAVVPATPRARPVAAVVALKPQAQTSTAEPAAPRASSASARKRLPLEPAVDPSTLPETPSRQAVIDAMTPLREEIARCAEGRGGVAELMLNVAGSGTVLHATIIGDYAGTAQGTCIAIAARKAHFAPFQQERFSVRYPVAL